MKELKKRFYKVIISLALASCLFLGNLQYVFAEEIDVRQEYLNKKTAGVEVYEITKENGDFMGYYEPCPDEETNIYARLGVSFSIGNWTIPASTTGWEKRKHSLLKGDKINVNITQIQYGAGYSSYLALRDADDGTVGVVNSSLTTNGWKNGVITVGYSGHFNFGIKNTSTHSITYTGNY